MSCSRPAPPGWRPGIHTAICRAFRTPPGPGPCRAGGEGAGWAGPPPEADAPSALACGVGVAEEVVDLRRGTPLIAGVLVPRPPCVQGLFSTTRGLCVVSSAERRPPRLENVMLRWSRKLLGMHPLNWFPPEVQLFQIGEVAQLRRYLPPQPVLPEIQPFQVDEVAQLRRYLPAQLVLFEVQPFQVGEVAQLRRYLLVRGLPGRRGCPAPPVSPAQLVPEVQPFQVGEAA